MSLPTQSMAYFAGSSSGSTDIQHCRLKYSVGAMLSSGTNTSASRSYPSSRRQSSHGAHAQFASRKAARSLG